MLKYSSREALTTAPPAAVRLNVGQVEMKLAGGMRNESREWTMPLSNLRFYIIGRAVSSILPEFLR